MKSLRRSLNNNGNGNGSSSQPSSDVRYNGSYSTPAISRPSEKVAPPQKVIKALSSYRSQSPQELSFTKGDFWYVTSERDGWYEALNPLTGSRGLVPKDQFEEFTKGGSRPSASGSSSGTNGASRTITPPHSSSAAKPPSGTQQENANGKRPAQPLYAVVQYDFKAERPDELDARAGDPIVVIARSNHEWFIAKPIGRLGGAGLIPVAFVEIRDLATDRPLDIVPSNIPQVDEYEKASAERKAAHIPLGRFDFGPDQAVNDSPFVNQASASSSSLPRSGSSSSMANSSSMARVEKPPRAIYKPIEDPILPPGQFTLLAVPSFHSEQGNYWFRIHATYVPDDEASPAFTLSLYRQYEDFYDFQISLLDAFPTEAGRSRPGEEDRSPPPRILPYMPGPVDDETVDDELTEYRRDELDAYVVALLALRNRNAGHVLQHDLFRSFFAARYGDYCEEFGRTDALEELKDEMSGMTLTDDRAPSAASYHSQGILPSWTSAKNGSRGPSPLPSIDTRGSGSSGNLNSARQSGTIPPGASSSWGSIAPINPVVSQPPAQNGQLPYVKIKIYDRVTDDLIAIRVHPSVSCDELFDKVRARLGDDINSLRFRTSMSPGGGGGGYREIRDDRDLRQWMRVEDQKLVLYAEQVEE